MYIELFKEIHQIMQQDYAGWMESNGIVKAEPYLKQLEDLAVMETLNDQQFSQIVNTYLLNYQDNHVYFVTDNEYVFTPTNCGFTVIRHQGSLFIKATNDKTELKVGTEIVAIDGKSIEWNANEYAHFLRDKIDERQQWQSILNRASTITVKTEDHQLQEYPLAKYDYAIERNYEVKVLQNDVIYFKMPHFSYTEQLEEILENVMALCKTHSKLIFDLRDNGGGNASLLNPLLPYFFSANEKPSMNIPNRLFNCTSSNADAFIDFVQEMRPQITDEDTIAMLEFAIKEFSENRGKGFVSLDFSKLLQARHDQFQGIDDLTHIVILTNCRTASAAEENVALCKQSSKVTVIGQATLGINDYSDLVIRKWAGKFSLYYPISKVEDFTPVHPIHGKGIHPDIHIPFQIENLYKDAELEYALQFLQDKAVVK